MQPEYDSKASDEDIRNVMEWILKADPKADAYSAYNKGDRKFIAYKLHHRHSIPIFERECNDWSNNNSRDKVLNSRVKYIKGTGYKNSEYSYEHQKLNAIAELYIESYNFTLWIHLQENNEFKCTS